MRSQLAKFDFDIKFRSGRVNRNADALSRKTQTENQASEVTLQPVTKTTSLCSVKENLLKHKKTVTQYSYRSRQFVPQHSQATPPESW